jgi:hypothetical protein
MGAIGNVRRLEDLLHVRLGLQAHVLLAERGGLLLDVGVFLHVLADASVAVARCVCIDGTSSDLQAAPTEAPSSAACDAYQQWRSRPRPRRGSPSSCWRTIKGLDAERVGVKRCEEYDDGWMDGWMGM